MKPYIKIADTKKLTHEEWLEIRKQGIGGSEESLSERKREGETSVKVYHSTRD